MTRTMLLAVLSTGLVLGGCTTMSGSSGNESTQATALPSAPSGELVIMGSLAYRARIALPDNAVAVLEVRDLDSGQVVAEQRIELKGRQVPVPMLLTVPNGALRADGDYEIRGGIKQAGQATWVSEPVKLSQQVGALQLGTVLLKPYEALAFSSRLQCGDQQIDVGFKGDTMVLQAGQKRFDLSQVRTASGAKYVANSDPQTWFWSKGRGGMLQLNGKSYPECVPVKQGAESMKANALQGAEWRVADAGPRPATLNFAADGRISGFAGCNRYFGQYTQNGDALKIGSVATTRMACDPAVMKQEAAFLQTLGQVQRFSVADDGTLTLHAADKAAITARR
ncbi:META domain-containing protein [Jeongeupia naejangsanensis]|uniref:META domain-containing protein n=1 Tax=Jeongeupia naejangsanensis TaxID=613195 RepID=A0ABS2BM36_9NEIS|nr:META domain-containing protein [Jeongeupia naejangsanensis]MBM3116684.1 META domain-containing protein [Jeongeupia naejangsanensis]